MSVDPRAGRPATAADLVDVARLVTAYYTEHPDPGVAAQRVAFGTSGHRGSARWTPPSTTTTSPPPPRRSASTAPPRASTARCSSARTPTRCPSRRPRPRWRCSPPTASPCCWTPTTATRRPPRCPSAILEHNASGPAHRADGIVVTPSHNPPRDGGFKYNPPHGGPADSDVTGWIQDRANALLADGLAGVRRVTSERARAADTTARYDFLGRYVEALPTAIDVEAIRRAGVRIGADPLGGASVAYWSAIADRLGLDLTVVNPLVDPTFRFMTLDWDGKIRMDCSSPYAMASLIERRSEYAIATGNDADADRHGIVTPDAGLMNPNHFLAVAIEYLLGHRDGWPAGAAIGKTLVSSSMIDRVVGGLGRTLVEVPVGFKWFVPGLLDGSVAFGGEESAGASFLRRDGRVWTTDKDGILLDLLAAEIIAVTGSSPSEHYRRLTEAYGDPSYARVDAPATREQKAVLARLSPEQVTATMLAGEPIEAKLTAAPGNGAALGGLKVTTASGWFAARPSGTEDVYKIYAESFTGPEHLARIQAEARDVVAAALGATAPGGTS